MARGVRRSLLVAADCDPGLAPFVIARGALQPLHHLVRSTARYLRSKTLIFLGFNILSSWEIGAVFPVTNNDPIDHGYS